MPNFSGFVQHCLISYSEGNIDINWEEISTQAKGLETRGHDTDPKVNWPYLIQNILDEVFHRKLSLIADVVITLTSAISASILPFFEGFWEIPYAVGILIFISSFTIIPIIFFVIKVFLAVRKNVSLNEASFNRFSD